MPSAEDEETGQVDLSGNINTTANNNIIQFWNVILFFAKYISTYTINISEMRMKWYIYGYTNLSRP